MRLGLIVNPLAGIGGPLALHGSEGQAARAALAAVTARGGTLPWSAARAARALAGLAGPIITCAGAMGQSAADAAGVPCHIACCPPAETSAADTVMAARALIAAGAELLLFAGGDGTARDLAAAGLPVPLLGIPAGVKMHSAVFAPSPASAAAMIAALAAAPACAVVEAEVLDRDDAGQLMLFGTMRVPAATARQPAKAAAGSADADLAAAIAAATSRVRAAPLAIIGPGLTMHRLKQELAGDGTLLGVDAYAHGQPVARDATAAQLERLAGAAPPLLVLGIIGGQGFLFGRGNQQLSPRLIAAAPWLVLASADKLAALPTGRLLVDTGDEALDAALAGRHIGVVTAPRRTMMMRIDAA